jgi:hypothetical protein
MVGRGRFRRRGLEGRGAAQPQAAGDRADQARGRGPRGRGTAAQPLSDGDRKPAGERGASARGATPGRARCPGARVSDATGGAPGSGAEQEQPCRGRCDNPVPNVLDAVATSEIAATDGGKGKRKRTVECVICMADHYTNQCSLLRGPKLSVAYCAAQTTMVVFSIFRLQMSMT